MEETVLSRWTPSLMRLLIGFLILAVLFAAVLLVRAIFFGASETPRTALERAYMDSLAAIKRNPNDVKARADLGAALAAMGRYNSAIKELRQAIKIDPGQPKLYYVIGVAYEYKGDLKQAEKNLKQAVKMEGEVSDFYADVYYELGQVYYAQKDYKNALQAYESSIASSSVDPVDVMYKKASVQEKLGQKQEAVVTYQDILRFDPDNKGAIEALKRLGVSPQSSQQPGGD